MKRTRELAPILVIIFIIIVLVGLVWANYRLAEFDVSGSGFSIQWIGIHSLITTGESPYSDQVNADIKNSVNLQSSFAPGIAPRFTSPLYSGAVVLPFALIGNKVLSQAVWQTLQFVALFAIMTMGIRLSTWKPRWYIFTFFSFLTIFSYHFIVPWLDGGLSVWSAFFLTLALLVLSQNRTEIAGILLGLSAIQPQMVILPIIFILIWAASTRRRILILWFFITLIFFSILGLFLIPGWITQYFKLLYNFQQNFPPGSPGILFINTWPGLGKQLGWLLSAIMVMILLIEWWLARKKEFRWFLWTACLTMVISQWIGIPTIPANYVELLLPLILISAMLAERWPRTGNWVAVGICLVLFIWEWAVFYTDLTSTAPSMQLNLLIPLPLILLIGLYWVRWWAIKPRKLLVEELKFSESY